jgi:1,4-alpha-glucan branching enzyme
MAGNRIIPSQRPFMGAMPYADGAGAGVTFRVWAPFAQQVNVAGEFNNWSKTAYALASEGNGYWSVDVPGAGVNQQYKFVLSNPIGNQFWRMDPYARSITDDGGNINGLIASSVEGYGTPGYSTPSWNELIIYELHIGTFTKDDAFNGKGTFASASTRLDYLKDLGVNAIEILPLGEFIGDISSGYNPAYIFAIEDEFGGPDGFRQFVNAAHQRGIAVIVRELPSTFFLCYTVPGSNDQLALYQL